MSAIRGMFDSKFIRSVATLSGASGVVMALPILAAPLLGRIYEPSDYGPLAQYMSFAVTLSAASSLQYQGAIIAERGDRRAGAAVWLCLAISVVFATVTALVVTISLPFLSVRLSVGPWLALLPLTVLFGGLSGAAAFVANRDQRYGAIARFQVLVVMIGLTCSISLGLQGWAAKGLLFAYFAGQASRGAGDLWLLCTSPILRSLRRPSLNALKSVARRHWRFPVFTLPTAISEQFTQQIPVLAMGFVGADASVGAFARARQLVSMPLTLLGSAVTLVFRRDASALYQQTGDCRALAAKVSLSLLSIGVIPCGLFMLWAPKIMVFILGPAWAEAGVMARMLAPMLLVRIIASPISSIFYFTDNQALDFKLTLSSTVALSLMILAAFAIEVEPLQLVGLFSLGYSAIYLAQLVLSLRIAKRPTELETVQYGLGAPSSEALGRRGLRLLDPMW